MTTYHGGKQRVGKKLAEIIYEISTSLEEDLDLSIKGYCEPFVGMCGVYQHIPELFKNHRPKLVYKAGDVNDAIIIMWKAAQKGWKPPLTCTREKFNKLKSSKKSSPEKTFVGCVYTYRGVYLNSYFPHKLSKVKSNAERVKSVAKKLKNVQFRTGAYQQFSNLKQYIIYCDPPYDNTTQYFYDTRGNRLNFDHTAFWNWCRKMSKDNLVFISSYTAPKDFTKIFTKGKEKLYFI
jgi:DNA adenine methylase